MPICKILLKKIDILKVKNKNDHATGYIQVRAHDPQTNVYGVVPLRLSVK